VENANKDKSESGGAKWYLRKFRAQTNILGGFSQNFESKYVRQRKDNKKICINLLI